MSRFDFTFQQDSGDNTGGGDPFPSRLKDHSQWLVTHDKPWDDDWHKRPKHPTSWNDDGATLLSFEEVYDRYKSTDNTGIAFRFTDDGPFVGFDFDKVRVDGDFTEEVLDLVQRLDSYTEVSSSGKGLHVIAEGDHLDDRKNEGQLSDCGELEVYDTDRYFVLTGDVYDGFTSVESRPTVTREVQDDYLPERQKFTFTGQQKPLSEQEFDRGKADATPEQVRQTIRAYVKTDSHDVNREVLRLWRGGDEGRPSASEADMAFVKQLYYWCRGDQQLIDECFRASGRMRPKWDEYRGDQTYGEMTIRKVCRTNSDTFAGRYVERGRCLRVGSLHPPVLSRRSSTEEHEKFPIYAATCPTLLYDPMTIGYSPDIGSAKKLYYLIVIMMRDSNFVMEYKIAQEYPVTKQQIVTINNAKKALLNPSLAITVAKAQIKDKLPVEEYSSKYLDIAEGGFSEYPNNIKDYAEWSWQFDFIKQFGLEPDDYLLDIGCGYLRGGVQFIPYLSTGHYYGIDISEDAIRESKQVIREYELSNKNPTVFQNSDLKFNNSEFKEVKFDYILAQSVITHLPPENVEELFANIHKVLDDDGAFIATYHKSPDNTIKQFARIVDFGYPWEFFEDISQEYNLDISEIEGNHPKDHSLIKTELN